MQNEKDKTTVEGKKISASTTRPMAPKSEKARIPARLNDTVHKRRQSCRSRLILYRYSSPTNRAAYQHPTINAINAVVTTPMQIQQPTGMVHLLC